MYPPCERKNQSHQIQSLASRRRGRRGNLRPKANLYPNQNVFHKTKQKIKKPTDGQPFLIFETSQQLATSLIHKTEEISLTF